MVIKKEFIGKEAKITYSNITFKGIVVDETKNTLTIKTEKGKKSVIKQNSIIEIENKKINGKQITKRPEDRIKLTKKV